MPLDQEEQVEIVELIKDENYMPKLSHLISKVNDKIQIMLMSNNDELKKLTYYLFSSVEDVDFYMLDDFKNDDLSMLKDMDIVIFNTDDMALKDMLLQTIKIEELPIKFFEISTASYLRQKDLLLAHTSGVDKLFKRDFLMEDFVISIEMFLRNNFYSKRVFDLYDQDDVLYHKKEDLEKKVDLLLERKVFFSLLSYEYEAELDLCDYNIRKIVREYDNIFINEDEKTISFLILNTVPEFSKELIQRRIENFSINLTEKRVVCAFDLVFE